MTTEFNIPYGKLSEQKLDYYKTENAESSPLFVYFHGGGLECGDRSNGTPIAFEYLANRGISVVSADYRMYPSALYVGGQSAGGYISMMLAFDKRYLAAHGIDCADKNQIAGFYLDAGQPTVHYNVLRERGLDTRLIRVDEAAPVYFIEEPAHPELLPRYEITVSDNDMVCRLEQNMMLRRTMLHVGYPEDKVKLVIMEGYTHCGYGGVIDEDGLSKYGKMVEKFIRG